jgi:very-short-patch-repair endonuclease
MANEGRPRELRKTQTPAEEVLWQRLRDRQLGGLKFRRQCPLSRYIADFCCQEARLVVEVDGEVHENAARADHDENRDSYLKALGYEVLRFTNRQVLGHPEGVLERIVQVVDTLRPGLLRPDPISPSPGEGDGEAGEGAGG